MKLPHQLTTIAFAAYMAGIIAFVVSAFLTAINSGVGAGFAASVLHAYAVALPVAFVCVLLFRPVALFLVKKTVHAPPLA